MYNYASARADRHYYRAVENHVIIRFVTTFPHTPNYCNLTAHAPRVKNHLQCMHTQMNLHTYTPPPHSAVFFAFLHQSWEPQ